MGESLPPSVTLDAITQFLSGDDWRQEKNMKAFIENNCVLFDGDMGGEYSHVHHEVWQAFMKQVTAAATISALYDVLSRNITSDTPAFVWIFQVDAILTNLVKEIGGRVEDLEAALKEEAMQRARGPREASS